MHTLHQHFNIKPCKETVRQTLRRAGIKPRLRRRKPLLTKAHRKARREFVKEYQSWPAERWDHVIFCEEKIFSRIAIYQRLWTTAPKGSRLSEADVRQVPSHGGGSIGVWANMTSKGPGFIHKIQGNLNADQYLAILQEYLPLALLADDAQGTNIWLLQDNSPVHKAKKVQDWLAQQPIHVLRIPANSPDLNPIENLWATLQRELAKYKEDPVNLKQLWERVMVEFYETPSRECSNLTRSMPDRIDAVRRSRGSWTRY